MSSPQDELRKVASHTLTNYASCRSYIASSVPTNPDNGEFYASLVLCFGDPDISKAPIDDLHSKAIAAILLAADKYAKAQVRGATLRILDSIPHSKGCPLSQKIGEQCLCFAREFWTPAYEAAVLNQKEETDESSK